MSKIKLSIKRSPFFELISQANSLIEKRNVSPVLSKVLLQAEEKSLLIQATDQNNSLQGRVQAKVSQQGKTVIDAQSLYDILKELSEGELELSEQSDKKIKIKQGPSLFHLLSSSAKDFPVFPPFQMENSFFIKSLSLRNMIEKTFYCSSLDETRYHLTGVFFEVKPSVNSKEGLGQDLCVRFVATDGHRLGLAEQPCKVSLDKGVIISQKGVQEIRKLVAQAEKNEETEIMVEPPRILLKSKDTVLSVKLVEGEYPNYSSLIPKKSAVKLTLNAEHFEQALKRVSLLSSSRFKGVNFHIMEKKIQMEAENPELGSARDEVACVRQKGEDLKARFNAGYILAALSSMGKGPLELSFGGGEKPCVLSPIKEKGLKKSLCVVMPMKM